MPKVELTLEDGTSIGAVSFKWKREDSPSSDFSIVDLSYDVTDDAIRTALVDTAHGNPEGLTTADGRCYPTLEHRLDGIYTALWWVRNKLALPVQWKGPKLTPRDDGVIY